MGNKNEPIIVFGGSRYENHAHQYNTTVIEQRAPTDESIKILDEVYNKTISRIMDRIKVTNSLVEFDAIFMNSPLDRFEDVQVHVKFMLNGQTKLLKLEITQKEYKDYSRYLKGATIMFNKIYQLIGKEISIILCDDIAKTELFKNI